MPATLSTEQLARLNALSPSVRALAQRHQLVRQALGAHVRLGATLPGCLRAARDAMLRELGLPTNAHWPDAPMAQERELARVCGLAPVPWEGPPGAIAGGVRPETAFKPVR